jgi:hypothetical protein
MERSLHWLLFKQETSSTNGVRYVATRPVTLQLHLVLNVYNLE